jgi:hypothetical protein
MNVSAATWFVEWANTVVERETAGNEWPYGRGGRRYPTLWVMCLLLFFETTICT